MSIVSFMNFQRHDRNSNWLGQVKTTCIAMVLSFGLISVVQADDTEVFFGQIDRTKNSQPNVMFVLDTSGSMLRTDPGEPTTRLDRMKKAVASIINRSPNINFGLMRFNGSRGGGAVVYPVNSLDAEVCASDNCGEIHLATKISSPNDDIEQHRNGFMEINGKVLSLESRSTPGNEKIIGMRFPNLAIPQGATITNAFITYTARSNNNRDGVDQMEVYAEQSNNAAPYLPVPFNASSRQRGTSITYPLEPWTIWQSYATPDLSQQVQEIVSRGDWCGGNAMSFTFSGANNRAMVSYDHIEDDNLDPDFTPVLNVSYDTESLSAGDGCVAKFANSQIQNSFDDAEEYAGNRPRRTGNVLNLFSQGQRRGRRSQKIGLVFNDVDIPKNANILDASIEFTMRSNSFGRNSAIIHGQASDSARSFANARNEIRNRPKTTASVRWNNLPRRNTNEKLSTPDLTNIVQEITRRNGWNSGNSMGFIMDDLGSTGEHPAHSANSSLAFAPKLTIKYESVVQPNAEEQTFITVRELMLNELQSMSATGSTPIVGAFHEAVQYFKGGRVDYGTRRGFTAPDRSHRVSHPTSYTGGSVFREPGCTSFNLNDEDCVSERIEGVANYITPLASSCQTNHIVLLSDGRATGENSAERVQSTIGSSCDTSVHRNERCGVELADWLANGDISDILPNAQRITTHSIGFTAEHPFLASLASAGGGRYFRADSADDLVTSFENILAEAHSVDTSFVAPGATVNQFNRLTHRNDIYYAVFKPESRPTWSGNLKKYEVGFDASGDPTLYDFSTPRRTAVDPNTGFFADNAKSGWSSEVDGSTVARGGAAQQLATRSITGFGVDGRNLYTVLADDIPDEGVDIIGNGTLLHERSTNITDSDLALTGTDGNVDSVDINRNNLLQWARGVDIKDGDGDGNVNELRGHLGDPMHSEPVLVNYFKSNTESYTSIFVGTNEGILHSFDSEFGQELFGFMPKELLPNIRQTFENSASVRHPYGMDGPISTWIVDSNNNVAIDADETAMLFAGMRRGGNNYYAIDISDRLNPRLQWVIKGGENGDADFQQLGQTWSTMKPTKIRYQDQERDVLIFGGGYDTNNDVDYTVGAVPKTEDAIGRAIFIVDAYTGELIYQLGHPSDTGADQSFDDMRFAIPADIQVMDFDTDGFADTLFASDQGGQVWRFDFDLFHDNGNLFAGGGVMAQLGNNGANSVANSRRFFNQPSVALIRENGERYVSISIGSGWSSHPLNTEVLDRVYSLRSYDIFNLPDGYGKRDAFGSYSPITEGDLTDVTNDLEPQVNVHGWMTRFTEPGEKVAGQLETINNSIIFTTYRPETNIAVCATALGSGAAYAMRVSNGRPSLDLDEDGQIELDDRYMELAASGIPPEISVLILENTNANTIDNNTGDTEEDEDDPSYSSGHGNNTGDNANPAGEPEGTLMHNGQVIFEGLFGSGLTRREFWLDAGMTQGGVSNASIDAPSSGGGSAPDPSNPAGNPESASAENATE